MTISNINARYADHIQHLLKTYSSALEAQGFDGLVIQSGHALKKLEVDDQYWSISANPSFAHFLPLTEESGALVVHQGRAHYLRGQEASYWEGPTRMESDEAWNHIECSDMPGRDLSVAFPKGNLAFIGDDIAQAQTWGVNKDAINPTKLISALDQIRAHKTPYEVACITEANRRASLGHRAIADAFMAGESSELQLLLRYLSATDQDSDQTPYKSIVACGTHASILHHVQYAKTPAPKTTSLLVDAGVNVLGYASDITRTMLRGEGKGASLFKALLDQLESMQQTLVASVKAGLAYETLHEQSHHLLAETLSGLNICSLSVNEMVDSGVTRAFFPHGLGHSLGLQVHDVGCKNLPPSDRNPHLRTTVTLAKGHVMTIEPGCYFIEPLLQPLRAGKYSSSIDWTMVDALKPYGGIRIEDNVLVTEDSFVNLTRDNWGKAT